MEESPYINIFSNLMRKQPSDDERLNIDNLIKFLPDELNEDTKQHFIFAIQCIWTAYYIDDWRTHVQAIIGKWYYTHSNRYYKDSIVEENDRQWMQTALNASTWTDALHAFPAEVLICWGI